MMKKSVFSVITSLVVISPIGFALPTVAANVSLSSTKLNLSNFSHVPQDVGVVADIDSNLIVDEGEGQIDLIGDSLFISDSLNFQAFSDSQWQTSISTLGELRQHKGSFLQSRKEQYFPSRLFNRQHLISDYVGVGQTDIDSQQSGSFEISADSNFSFDIEASVLLHNQIDDYSPSALSSLANLNLILRDEVQQKDWDILNFEGIVNTNFTNTPVELSGDFFDFNTSPYLKISNLELSFVGGEDEELLSFALNGSWEMPFHQDTQLSLLATNNTCNYNSNVEGVCDRFDNLEDSEAVPEPSTSLLSMILLFFGYKFKKSRAIK